MQTDQRLLLEKEGNMKKTVSYLVGAAILGLTAQAPAAAATTSVAGVAADGLLALRQLNLIVLGNLNNGQHVQGKAFVGGNVTGNVTVAQGGKQSYTASNYAQLTVGGNANGFKVESALGSPLSALIGGNARDMTLNGQGRVDVGGNVNVQNFNPNSSKTVRYGGTLTGAQQQDKAYLTADAGYAASGTGIAATIAKQKKKLSADLSALSLQLSELAALSTITGTGTALDYSKAKDGYAVFTMTAAAFQDQNANFDRLFGAMPAGITTIINVQGDRLNQGGNLNGEKLNQSVIWNFAQATSITTKGWHGSILAPTATLRNTSAIEGSVAVRDFIMDGEVHLGTFNGTGAFLTPAAAVPEPATWAQLLFGFALAGGALRYRRRPAAAIA
jgi:choice-of-anchor A domain-containing protein